MFPSFNARALGLKLTMDETLRLASQAGFSGIDVMVRDAIEEGVDFGETRRKMGDLGLRPGAFPFPFDWRGTAARFDEDLSRLAVYAKAAAKLEITRTGTWVMPEAPESLGSYEAAYDLHLHRLRLISVVLNDFGIRLGLEVIGVPSSRTRRGWPFIYRFDQIESIRGMIERLGKVPIGLVVDSWHLYAAGEPISHALAWGVDKIVWVHVADLPAGDSPDRSTMIDSVRGLPGEHGAVPSRDLLAALKIQGYDGPVTAEPLAGCRSLAGLSPESVAEKTARSLQAIWPD